MIAQDSMLSQSWFEGGAVVVMTGAFLVILQWMLRRFSRALEEIETAQHGLTLSILALQQMLLRHDYSMSGMEVKDPRGEEASEKSATKKYSEIQTTIDEIKAVILGRINSIATKHDSDKITLPKLFG